jgi:hypothetical protein
VCVAAEEMVEWAAASRIALFTAILFASCGGVTMLFLDPAGWQVHQQQQVASNVLLARSTSSRPTSSGAQLARNTVSGGGGRLAAARAAAVAASSMNLYVPTMPAAGAAAGAAGGGLGSPLGQRQTAPAGLAPQAFAGDEQQPRSSSSGGGVRSGCSAPQLTADTPLPWDIAQRQAAIECLQNRKIWLLGNSVSRHWAFALEAILVSNLSKGYKMERTMYDAQKDKCGRGGAWKGQRPDTGGGTNGASCFGLCECTFEGIGAVLGPRADLVFGWIYEHYSDGVEQSLLHGTATTDGGSEPPDIVIYNAGLPQGSCPSCNSGTDVIETAAPALGRMVSRVLEARPDLHFYWRGTTALCPNHPLAGNQETQGPAATKRLNDEIQTLNDRVEAEICQVPGVQKLDGFAWTHDHCAKYDDNIHHSELAFEHVTAFLRVECAIQ